MVRSLSTFPSYPQHLLENTWKTNNWKEKVNKSDPKGYQTATKPSPKPNDSKVSVSLTKKQMEQLYKLLTPTSLPNNSSTSLLAQKGTFSFALNGVTQRQESWIIDLGATDHMTGCANLFSTYTSSLRNFKVKIADGSLSTVASMGTIEIGPNLILRSVLHVPNLTCNLLSISKLTQDLNCVAKFSHSTCTFQDLTMERTIGNAREHGGLYYLEKEDFINKQAQTIGCKASSLSRKQEIMLWHCRLSHPNFPYLKDLFSSMFKKNDLFQCEVCQLAKHQRSVFPSHPYKPSKPFALIYSNLWGPSRVHIVTGKKWFVIFIDNQTKVC